MKQHPILRAQFMHQHKDKVVYEKAILLDTPSLNQYYGKPTTYLEFDVPLNLGTSPAFVRRWVKSYIKTSRNTHVTRRSLRFIGSDGTTLCELSERPLKVNIYNYTMANIFANADVMTIHVCCIVKDTDIKELSKFFFK